ncbi:MAG: AAA family ATPase, partial [Puniceicoccales bacterium]|nr:AAA family ATPase [Puniceicoccales bacterium]
MDMWVSVSIFGGPRKTNPKFRKIHRNAGLAGYSSPLENIIAPWLKAGSIGFIFGKHWIGKTSFAWDMANCISKGEDFGP